MHAEREQSKLEDVADWIRTARQVVALSGAGISTESGIPDFRGPQGVWTKNPEAEKKAHISYYLFDRAVRVQSWKFRIESPAFEAEPNPGHVALAELERRGVLHTLITQNVDGLHLEAGSSRENLIEIHGTIHEVVCMNCGERAPMRRALDRVKAGEEDPPCRTCGGILKSATISFGQSLVPNDLERSQEAAAGCDVFLAVGTSLGVYPVAYLPEIALRAGARLAIFNEEETPYDPLAHAVFRDRLGEILPRLVELV